MAPSPPARLEQRLRTAIGLLALAYFGVLAALAAVWLLAPARSGWLALSEIFAPYLYLPAIALAVLAFWPGGRAARLALAGCVLLFAVQFVPGMVSVPPAEAGKGEHIIAAGWNLLEENTQEDGIARRLAETGADIIALQELAPSHADAITANATLAERYPYQVLNPKVDYVGTGILSVFPVLDHGSSTDPPATWARLDVGGRTLLVVGAHPLPGEIDWTGSWGRSLPVNFNAAPRDRQIAGVLNLITQVRRDGEPMLLLGDFNVTEREPAYQDLSHGLTDAHRAAGFGPGNTWKSWILIPTSIGVLRIDYQFAGPGLTPLRFTQDCDPQGSDHCLTQGSYQLQP